VRLIVTKTKNDNINTAAGIINLKSNHNWTDRQAVDQKQSITIEGLPSELDELLDDDEA
jgi:hypothetical protein